jgi:hypothetical protein
MDATASGGPGALEGLRAAAHDCRACPLWKRATQTVFGETRNAEMRRFVKDLRTARALLAPEASVHP